MAKVLVVEDEAFLRELIIQKLAKEGYEVLVAVDGEQGVSEIREHKPDLVLLDLVLPGMDGFEVLQQAKADPETAPIPVVILSNLGQKQDVDRGMKLGAKDFLVKAQFTPGEIVEKVRSALSQ